MTATVPPPGAVASGSAPMVASGSAPMVASGSVPMVASGSVALALPPGPASVPAGRAFTSGALAGRLTADELDDLLVLVSELLTDALAADSRDVRLGVELGRERVRVVVRAAAPSPTRRLRGPDAPGGGCRPSSRLVLVEALASAWGAKEGERGTTWWCELPCRAVPGPRG